MTCSAPASAAAESNIEPMHIHRSSRLADVPGVVHGVTRRVIGTGLADGNIGYSAPRDRDDAWRMRVHWMEAAGLNAEVIVVGSQRHGNGVATVRAADAGRGARPESGSVGIADGLVTNETGVVLLTLHADCMPVMLCDPNRRVVATVHAGWRGTVADIAGEAVRTMQGQFGSEPAEIVAYLGPAIGACCYEVGEDVYTAWTERAGRAASVSLSAAGDRWTFDLAAANRWWLECAGVLPERIDTSGICTRCNGDEWFSHRGQGAATGRYGAFIALMDSVR